LATRIGTGALLTVPLDPAAATPFFRQLYEGLRCGILDGTLAPGLRLPAV
jgi:DNA-binding transcriptional regulator YhcF (GntR family)